MKIPFCLSKSLIRFAGATVAFFMATAVLPGQERFRLGDPQALSASGSGWAVDPRTGGLSMVMPVGQVGGEIPIPLSLRINGQFKIQEAENLVWVPGDPNLPYPQNKGIWEPSGTTDVVRPVFGTMHMGYIVPCSRYDGPPNSEFIVLEDGTQFRTSDFLPYSSYSPYPLFRLPESFGFLPKTSLFIQNQVLVSNLGSHALYSSPSAEFGPTWQAKIQSLAPVGFGTISDAYRVLMDKDRARIMVKLPSQNLWVPILWVDRFNHWVGLKWQRNTLGLAAGITSTYSLEVKNHRNQGVMLTWADFASQNEIKDLIRAEFIGIDAPSILVQGYPGTVLARPETVSSTNPMMLATVKVAGPVGRPTNVQIGQSADIRLCSWSQSVPPPSGNQMASPTPNGSVVIRTWSFGYEANRAAIQTMTDSMGVQTDFTFESVAIPTTQTLSFCDTVNGEDTRYMLGNLTVWGVKKSLSKDGVSGKTLSRGWNRSTTTDGEPSVEMRETFGNDLDACPRWEQLIYTKSDQARDYGNGALKETRIMIRKSGESEPLTSTVYTLEGAGLDKSYSHASGTVIKRSGEPIQTIANQLSQNGYTVELQTLFIGSPAVKQQEVRTVYPSNSFVLDEHRVIRTIVTRFDAKGVAIPGVTTNYDYDANTWLLTKAYRQGTSGQLGSTYKYDSEGRLSVQGGWFGEGITAPSSQTYSYDPGTGQLATQTTSYLLENGSTASMSRSWSDFDSVGHAKTSFDERGLKTTQTFDTLGRVISTQGPAGPVTNISYDDVWTRRLTQGSSTVTEKTDGFGRVIERTDPTGMREEFSYDDFGRLVQTQKIDGNELKQNPSITVYDMLNRTEGIISPGGAHQTIRYSVDAAFPFWSLVTRTLNTPTTVSTSKEYRNAFGQVVRQVSPAEDVTEFTYDGTGNQTKVVLKPAGNGTAQTREFVYDEWGRLEKRVEPETGTTLFTNFNLLGQPQRIEEADGRVRTLTYDSLGRLVRMEGGKEKITYVYTGADLTSMSSVTDGVVVRQDFEYKGLAKQLSLEKTTQPGLEASILYGYDATTGLIKTVTYPSKRIVEYVRDPLGRITGIKQNGIPVVSKVSFDDWGNRSGLKFGSGAYSDWSTKDGQGLQLLQWNIGYPGGALDTTRFYKYDDAERLSMAGDWDKLDHDNQGRLITANSSSLNISTTHGHDAYGNNIKHQATGNVPAGTMNDFTLAPLPTNQLSGTLTGWKVNPRGEATEIGTETAPTQYLGLVWDGLGRLKAASYGAGFQSFLYAPSGMRVSLQDTVDAANNRRYAYSRGGMLLSEFAAASSPNGLRTLAASSGPSTAPAKPNMKANQTMAYLLPDSGGVEGEAGAWISQPSGSIAVTVGQAISFVGNTDFGTVLHWDFGDGTSVYGGSASHTYTTPGTYTVTFMASTKYYLASTDTRTITVVPATNPAVLFTASAPAIAVGGSVDLSWQVGNATSVSISGAGNVAATGSATVRPSATTTYTLTAKNANATVTSKVTVIVVQAPVFVSAAAVPAVIQPGQVTKLAWVVNNATSFELDQGIGTVPGNWAWVWPDHTITFTLTATNTIKGVSVTRSKTMTVTVGAANSMPWKRDVIYLGSEAVAEIDAEGVHELHNDHLGSPRIITDGSTGQIEGGQVFGPYGERISHGYLKEENGQQVLHDYLPLTGYTGHIQQDATGLIYMRGRFYSPAWHRFVNSDQGVDPNSWNQMAYVGGGPFQSTDPSGMMHTECHDGYLFLYMDVNSGELGRLITENGKGVPCSGGGGSSSGGSTTPGNGSAQTQTDPATVFQKQNDQTRQKLQSLALNRYLKAVGNTTWSWGAGAGGFMAAWDWAFGGPLGEAIGTPAGAFLGADAGMAASTIVDGIWYNNTLNQIQRDWQNNYNVLQNYYNNGRQGVLGNPSFGQVGNPPL